MLRCNINLYMSYVNKLSYPNVISLHLVKSSLDKKNQAKIIATPLRVLKLFKARRLYLRARIKKLSWRYKHHVYLARLPGGEIPRINCMANILRANLVRKWKKKFFYQPRRKRGVFAKAKPRVPTKSKRKRKRREHNYFMRGLVYKFKQIFFSAKRALKATTRSLYNFIPPIMSIVSRAKQNAVFSLSNRTHLNLKTLKKKFYSFLYTRPKTYLLKLTRFIKPLDSTKSIHNNNKKKSTRSKNRKRTIFVNLYKRYAWKLRSARFVHWDIRTFGTLNEWRYKKLLGAELNYLAKIKIKQFLSHIFMRCFCLIASWKSMKTIINKTPIVYNGAVQFNDNNVSKGDIIELPFGGVFIKAKRTYYRYFRRVVGRVKKMSYRSYLIRIKKRRHAKKYIRVPKAYTKLPIPLKRFGRATTREFSLNAIAFIRPIPNLVHDIWSRLNLTSVLSLQTWRYRFD